MSHPTILGPDGMPVDRAALGREIAVPTVSGVRAVLSDVVATGLSPEKLAATLRRAQEGEIRDYLTLAEDMEERYLHYASQVQTRRLAIEGVAPSLQVPKGVPARVADAVHELIAEEHFLAAIGALTDGVAKGYAVVEIMWEYERGALRPVDYKWRDQRCFQFDRLSMTELRLAVDGNFEGEALAPGKFIRHLPRAKMGIPIRRGFARAAAWAFLLQSFTLKDWAAFCEVYGLPLRVGKYHPGASQDDKRTLLRAVASIAADAAAIIPQGMEIEFIEVSGTHGERVFGALAEYLDRAISKLVVGQTMTADDGSSLAQARVHNEVRMDITRADCRQMANTINRDLIPWFVAFNFGPQDVYPRVEMPVAEPEDTRELSDAVSRLVPLGLKVSQREMREKLGLSEPAREEEVLVAPASPPEIEREERGPRPQRGYLGAHAHRAGCRCAACRIAALGADPRTGIDAEAALDALLDEALADWEDLGDPLLAPLRAALAEVDSFDELIARLPALSAQIDGSRLARALARLMAIARGIGDVTD